MGFFIWMMVGIVFILIGLKCFKKETPVRVWSNEPEEVRVEDIKAYNAKVGKIWCVYGILFIVLGIPLLMGQNSPWIFLSVLGVVFETIFLMIFYLRIEDQYRHK